MKKKITLIVSFILLIVTCFLLFPLADSTTTKQDVKNLYLNQFQISGDTDIYYDNQDVYEVQFAGETIWRAGSEVTYNLDVDNSQMIYYDYAKSIFEKAPSPQKEGWEFIGWSFSDEATPDKIITTYAADSTDFNMYAVFRKLITVTFYNNSATPTVLTDYAYYNNGNIDNPEFTLQPLQRDGWTLQGISTEITGENISTIYNDITLGENTTYYSIYTKPLNFTYLSNNSANETITKNFEVLYYSTGYNYDGITICTADEVDYKDDVGNAVCVWQELSTNKTYDLGISCPIEFYSSNVSDYTFNALYGSVVTYITKNGTFANGTNTMEKIVIYGNDMSVLNDSEKPTLSGYEYQGLTTKNSTSTVSNVLADGKPYTFYVRLGYRHYHSGSSGQSYANGCYTRRVQYTTKVSVGATRPHDYHCGNCGRGFGTSIDVWSNCPSCGGSLQNHTCSNFPYCQSHEETRNVLYYDLGCGYSQGQMLYSYSW